MTQQHFGADAHDGGTAAPAAGSATLPSASPEPADSQSSPRRSRLRWRVVDIVVLAVPAAACGVQLSPPPFMVSVMGCAIFEKPLMKRL